MVKDLKIGIGADHRGFKLKSELIEALKKIGCKIKDFGTNSEAPCDYPEVGFQIALAVANREIDRGILICKTGIGFAIVANKVPGIRAALCHDVESARGSREHNDSNVLVLGSDFVDKKHGELIVQLWLNTPFAGGRHARRTRQIEGIEQRIFKEICNKKGKQYG